MQSCSKIYKAPSLFFQFLYFFLFLPFCKEQYGLARIEATIRPLNRWMGTEPVKLSISSVLQPYWLLEPSRHRRVSKVSYTEISGSFLKKQKLLKPSYDSLDYPYLLVFDSCWSADSFFFLTPGSWHQKSMRNVSWRHTLIKIKHHLRKLYNSSHLSCIENHCF